MSYAESSYCGLVHPDHEEPDSSDTSYGTAHADARQVTGNNGLHLLIFPFLKISGIDFSTPAGHYRSERDDGKTVMYSALNALVQVVTLRESL